MRRSTIGVVVVLIALAIGYQGGILFHSEEVAKAAGGKVKSPNEVAPDRYVYYPGTEVLARNEDLANQVFDEAWDVTRLTVTPPAVTREA